MAIKSFVMISLAIGLATLAFAQNPPNPDLSGGWTLNLAKSKLVKGNHLQSETLVIIYSGANIQFRYHAAPGGKDWRMTYTVDGKQHVIENLNDDNGVPLAYYGHPLPAMLFGSVAPTDIHEGQLEKIGTDGRITLAFAERVGRELSRRKRLAAQW